MIRNIKIPNNLLNVTLFKQLEINKFCQNIRCVFSSDCKSSCNEDKKGEKNIVCTIDECMVDPCKPEPTVVIVGAGIAGLSAADRLATCGLTNFTVLEATERPGGRIHSCWLGDSIAELGCANISGACAINTVYNLAAQEGLLKGPMNEIPSRQTLFYTSDGKAIARAVANMAYHVFEQIEHEAASLFNMSSGKENGSLMHFLNIRIQQDIQKFPEEMRYDASRVLYGLMNSLRYRMGDDLNQVSADNFGCSISIPGGGHHTIPMGFIGVLSPLIRNLPDCCLKYEKPVGLIRWGAVQQKSKGPRAVVQCCDGEEYCADYVIITIPLGVLKEHADKLFCPALPASKVDAIRLLGVGNMDKIYLDYERPFWVWNRGHISLAWSSDELQSRTDWTKGISQIYEVESSKHVLMANVSGPEAAVMEHASDEEIALGITKLLRQFTGDATLPYPSTVLRSKWATDPYFCGSNCYMKVNSNIGHLCDLSSPVPGTCDPIPPILLFAGEATIAGHQGTVNGARLSGIREAERIIQLTKKFGGPPPRDL